MSYTVQVPCSHCDGTGYVKDYTARDIVQGSNDWEGTMVTVECPVCLAQGHVRVNPQEGPTDV